jgi:outer membrane receptor for ferrienterochelin and colicin
LLFFLEFHHGKILFHGDLMETRLIYVFTAAALLLQPMATLAEEVELAASNDSTGVTETNDDLMDLSLDDLMNVTVTTTSKAEEKISDAPGVISVMSRDELKRFGARTLKDVLMRMPSINLSTTYLSDRSCVSIRGDQINAAANHILLLINGRPVREAEEGGIKSEMFESFPVAVIDRIEVVRGPGSVLYGSNAFSGVINVITKSDLENEGDISLFGGVPGAFRGTGYAGYRFDDFSFLVGGQYKKAKAWNVKFQAADTVFRNFTIPDNGFGSYCELNYRGIRYMTSFDRWRNFYAIQKYIPDVPIPGENAYGNIDWGKWFNDLGYTKKINNIWEMSANVTYTQSWLDVHSFPSPKRNSYDLTGEWTNFFRPLDNLNVVVGILGNRTAGSQNDTMPSITSLNDFQNNYSGYIQTDYRFISEVKVIAGLQGNKAVGFDLDINPRLGLIWSPKDIVTVKALYSTAFRAPTIQEQYLDAPTLRGTHTLKPEKVQTFDFGITTQTENAFIGLNNFYSKISNSIYQQQIIPPPNRYANSNIPTTIVGMELEGKYFITKELMLVGSGLFQKNTTGDSAGNMMPVPEASAKGGISYSANGFTASVFNIYEGDIHKRYNPRFNKARDAFNLLNATIKYEISRLFKITAPVITLEVDGYNLLNQEIWLPPTGIALITGGSNPGPYVGPEIQGVSVYGGVTVEF